jgi:NAD(P)-dependent dehydrogenase (short-subunit alcohol dehydrogenase family)
MPLAGQVAVITGGAGGLGRAIAESLSAVGMRPLIADVRPAHTVPCAEALEMDVCDAEHAATLLEDAARRFGRLDVLVTCAGIDVTAQAEDISVEDFDRVLSVNLRGPFVLSRCALPIMKAQHRGHIVNIVSTAAKRAWPNATAYHASKWGLLGLSHALHVEARPHGVKVTAVIAGGMRTPFILERFPDTDPHVLQDPRNVADTIRFVISQPAETVIPEITVIPMRETSWP